MKYLLMIFNRPDFVDTLSEEEKSAVFARVGSIMTELKKSGELIGGMALAPPAQTRSVRQIDGRLTVTDGPFVEAKEQFAGYIAVDVASLERAEEIAASWPDVGYGGGMEIRAIVHDEESER